MARKESGRELGGSRGLGPLPFVIGGRGESARIARETQETIEFRNALLILMSHKKHWAASAFAGVVPKEKTAYHFESEARTFVEPFTRYLAGALAQCPVPEVRRSLAENIHEEENGEGARKVIVEQKLIETVPKDTSHFGLFLRIPAAMGHDVSEFGARALGPRTEAFRQFLFDSTQRRGWEVAVAVSTLFLEGNQHEWEVFRGDAHLPDDFKDKVPHATAHQMSEHPLHVAYGIPAESLLLPAVHHVFDSSDGEHRIASWNMLLRHISTKKRTKVLNSMQEALRLWQDWRDEVAERSGLVRDSSGDPVYVGDGESREV